MGSLFAWLGGGVFVGSLAYFAYTYAVTLGVPAGGDPGAALPALAIDTLLFVVFATHHSLFARPIVKRWLVGHVPPRLERSTFVWMASLLLAAVCALWQPLPGFLYRHEGPLAVLHALFVSAGVALTALGAGLLDPLELAGVAQARLRAGHREPVAGLVTRFPYNIVRHPIYLGWVLMVYGVPHMTWSRLAMASLSTAYLFVAVRWEERLLARSFGPAYEAYRQRVRWKIVPFVY